MKGPCIRHQCIQCCFETEMPLSEKDIELIKRLGFKQEFFVIDRGGWLQLKNYKGKCVFSDGRRCLIYKSRPEGCKVYPIVYDEKEKCASLDEHCPYRDEFTISEVDLVILTALVIKLKEERRQRKQRQAHAFPFL